MDIQSIFSNQNGIKLEYKMISGIYSNVQIFNNAILLPMTQRNQKIFLSEYKHYQPVQGNLKQCLEECIALSTHMGKEVGLKIQKLKKEEQINLK